MIRKFIQNFEEIIGSILLIAMCIVAVLQVASRYMFREPFSWTEELCTFMFIWLSFIGASLAIKTGEHFAVDMIVERIPGRFGWILRFTSASLVFFFTVFLVWFGIRFTITGAQSITPALEIPRSIPYAAIPIGGATMMLRNIQITRKLFVKNDKNISAT